MTGLEHLQRARRWWALVLMCTLAGLAAGWLTTEVKPPPETAHRAALWSATSIIIGAGDALPGLGSLTTLAALTKVGEVPARVADGLGRDDPASLSAAISAVADPETALLTISSRAGTPREAELLANAFARELVNFQQERLAASGDPALGTGAVRVLQRAKAYPGEPILTASGSLQATDDETERRRAQLFVLPADVDAEDENVKQLLEQGTSWRVPPGHPVRLAVSGGAGSVIGIALALLLAHLDTRIRTRRDGEENLSWPVLAEIPAVKSRRGLAARRFLTAPTDSAHAHPFRLLVAALNAALPAGQRKKEDRSANSRGHLILVTSPERGDGKTTVAVSLAASLVEDERNVLLLSCDLRNPALHKVLGLQDEDGLVDAMVTAKGRPILASATKIAMTGRVRLRVVTTGKLPTRPGQVLFSEGFRRVLSEARATADVVVIDASPLSTTSDAISLIPHVDAVLVVAASNKTTAERARAVDELLHRLQAPVVGVVINRVPCRSPRRRIGSIRLPRPSSRRSPDGATSASTVSMGPLPATTKEERAGI